MPTFQNVTGPSALRYTGATWAATWGDVNGDTFPDIWVSKHNQHSHVADAEDGSLYRNFGNGRFVDATAQRVPYLRKDYHGAAWADFDNDGDKDLAQVTGGTTVGGVTLFENRNGTFVDATADQGLARSSNAAGRNGLWLDYNNDGLLDFYLGATRTSTGGSAGRPSTIYRQTVDGTFVDANRQVGLTIDGEHPLLADLTGDGRPELILASYGTIKAIFTTTGTQFTDVKSTLLRGLVIPKFDDLAIADFDNDLRPDIYITRRGFDNDVVLSGRTIKSYIATVPAGEERGFNFSTSGALTFTYSRQDGTIDYDLIRVGAAGRNPITDGDEPSFTLSPSNPANRGIAAHNLTQPGIYIGYDAAAGVWEYSVVGKARPSRGVTVTSTAAVTNLRTEGFPLVPEPADQLLINTTSGFVDRSVLSRIAGMSIAGQYLTTGDYDNDGDVDIYVDQAGAASNRINLLLRNRGDGSFVRAGPDGAPGGPGGVGGAVASADYDRDGFLDILLSNGAGEPPFIPLNADGALQLYRNLGNGNHWIEMRLHGTESNADGIGARVIVTAGGHSQLREANGGQHIAAQDWSVLHFGLGQQQTINRIEVQWPSGETTVLRNVPTDQLLDIVEGEAAMAPVGPLGFFVDPGDAWTEPAGTAADSGTPGEGAIAGGDWFFG